MPIYQVDGGRAVEIDPVPSATAAFAPEGAALLGDQVGTLLGERLLPVAGRAGQADGPHLLAVDAAVQPVVIEVAPRLDDDVLVRAMQYLGIAETFTYRDIVALYHRGPERFDRDLEAFRDAIPTAALAAAFRHSGPRLLLVCTEVADSALPALRFMLEAGHPLEILQITVLHGADGRRYVDVSRLTQQVIERRVRESRLRLVHSQDSVETERGIGTGAAPVRARAERHLTEVAGGATGAGRTGAWDVPVDTPGWGHDLTPGVGIGVPAHQGVPHEAAAAGWASPGALALAELARALPTPLTLVWERRRRGQRFEAMLLSNGAILLADGRAFADPDEAATAACAADTVVDGWRVWRIGSGGPTLAEALER